jgi:hypothetical protein
MPSIIAKHRPGVAESFPLSSRTSRCYRFSMGKTSARSGNFWRLDAAHPHCHAAALQPQRKKIWHTHIGQSIILLYI